MIAGKTSTTFLAARQPVTLLVIIRNISNIIILNWSLKVYKAFTMLFISLCLWAVSAYASEVKEVLVDLQHSFDMSSFHTRTTFKIESQMDSATLITDNIFTKDEIQQLKVRLYSNFLLYL